MEKLTKAFKADANLEDNRLKVIASTTGNIDRSGDVILPGAFKSAVLRDFEQHGWIDIGHAWDGLPVAMPVSAKMAGDQLISEAEFHGTERGQEARQVVKERMDAGKSVSVSIGFMPDYSSARTFGSGAELLRWAEKDGLDVSAFDGAAIKAWKGATRAIAKVAELYEWSIVTVGMNPKAKAIAVKTFSLDDADSGCPLSEHLQLALGAAEDLATRLEGLGEARSEKGGHISPAHRESVELLIQRLEGVRKFFPADEPATAGIDEALRLRALQIRSAFITN